MDHTEVRGRVDSMLRAWNARDLDAFLAHMSPDVYWHDLGMPAPPAIGQAAVRAFAESVLRAFPDFRYDIRCPICVSEDGESCVVPWTITATNSGYMEPPGFGPSRRQVRLDGLDYIQFRAGLVTRIETRFDPAEAVEQLTGVRLRPGPGSWRERLLVGAQRMAVAWIRWRGARGADRAGAASGAP